VVKYEVERLREEAIAPYVMTLSALAWGNNPTQGGGLCLGLIQGCQTHAYNLSDKFCNSVQHVSNMDIPVLLYHVKSIHSLTHSLMELSSSWEGANCAATQEIIPAFYGTRRFITVFTRAIHRSLSWAR
jgi:hypothetical protein